MLVSDGELGDETRATTTMATEDIKRRWREIERKKPARRDFIMSRSFNCVIAYPGARARQRDLRAASKSRFSMNAKRRWSDCFPAKPC